MKNDKGLQCPPRNPVWNIWQGLVLILLVTSIEWPLGWLNSQMDLNTLAGLIRFLGIGFGECLLYFFLITVFFRLLKRPLRELGFVRVKTGYLILGLITGVLLFVTVGLLGSFLTKLFGAPAPQSFTEAVTGVKYGWEYIFLVLLGGIIAPMKEEMIFRGLIYPPLRQTMGKGKGILLAGTFFATLHSDLVRFLPLFLGGIVLTWLYERTRSLWPSVLAHGTWNILMMVALILQK